VNVSSVDRLTEPSRSVEYTNARDEVARVVYPGRATRSWWNESSSMARRPVGVGGPSRRWRCPPKFQQVRMGGSACSGSTASDHYAPSMSGQSNSV